MFWDPYERYNRKRRQMIEQERRRRLAEEEAARRAQAEAEYRRAHGEAAGRPPAPAEGDITARFAQELAKARRERDEWADRYDQLLASLEEQRSAIAAEREQVAAEREQLRAEARAEVESQRERVRRNAEQRAFEENRKILQRLLDVADNLERALAQVPEDEASQVAEGLRLTHRDFQRALAQAGVEPLDTAGQPFDPTRHEAIATAPSDQPSGTILQEVAPGYLYREALLRPAKVVVAQ